jgi:hypothetical protein
LDPILQQSLLDDRFYNNSAFKVFFTFYLYKLSFYNILLKTEQPVNGDHLNEAATTIQSGLKGQAVRDDLKG